MVLSKIIGPALQTTPFPLKVAEIFLLKDMQHSETSANTIFLFQFYLLNKFFGLKFLWFGFFLESDSEMLTST